VKVRILVLLFVLALSAAAWLPDSFSRNAAGTHTGIVACGAIGSPVSDGAISPGEYSESYFDSATKALVYFTCDDSPDRLMHVGIVAPGGGWVGLGVQARDVWDGMLNEVRMSRVSSSGALQIEDGLEDVAVGTFVSDSSLGGSDNVLNAAAGTAGAATIYEFALPLKSPDAADSQLQSDGPFYLAIRANPFDSDLRSEAMEASELQTFVVRSDLSQGEWTEVELSVATSEPMANSRILVSLRDEQGYPIPGMVLEVFVRTTFGFLNLGPVTTNDQGVAEAVYAPRDAGQFVVGAAYPGGNGLLGSAVWGVLEVAATSGGDLGTGLVGEGGTLGLRPIEALVVVVVGSVWATYAYALFVVRQTLRSKGSVAPAQTSTQPWKWER